MKYYYWESENSWGEVNAKDDKEAISLCKKAVFVYDKLLIVYKENDNTPLGVPFIIVWERE